MDPLFEGYLLSFAESMVNTYTAFNLYFNFIFYPNEHNTIYEKNEQLDCNLEDDIDQFLTQLLQSKKMTLVGHHDLIRFMKFGGNDYEYLQYNLMKWKIPRDKYKDGSIIRIPDGTMTFRVRGGKFYFEKS
tara:strand:+ start:858 stop:1250 length:393 start_codon:yes stop_codon:yes gene_type:complete